MCLRLTPAVAPSRTLVVWSWLVPLGFHTDELPSSRSKVLSGGGLLATGDGKTVGASGGGRGGEVVEGVGSEVGGGAGGGGRGEEATGVGERGGGRDGLEKRGRRGLETGGRGGGRDGGVDGGSGAAFGAGGGGLGRHGRAGGREDGRDGREVGGDGEMEESDESAWVSEASARGLVGLQGEIRVKVRSGMKDKDVYMLALLPATSM